TLEGVDPAEGNFTRPTPGTDRQAMSRTGGDHEGDAAGASAHLGHQAYWPGLALDHIPFSGAQFARYAVYSTTRPRRSSLLARGSGVTFYYGSETGPKHYAIPG